jgi:putative SOS response-associated peptidase YedK
MIVRRYPHGSGSVEIIEADCADSAFGHSPFVRAEGKLFPSHRCLIPSCELQAKVEGRHYRITLSTGEDFYLAGIWEASLDSGAISCRVITVAANYDTAAYLVRHGAIIRRHQAMSWLNHLVPEQDLLVSPIAHSLIVDEVDPPSVKDVMAF